MFTKRSLPSRAFSYESHGEHAKALAVWKKNKTQKLYPGAAARGAEIARVLGHIADFEQLLLLTHPQMILDEFGEIHGENLLIKLIENGRHIDFKYPKTPRIEAARWAKGLDINYLDSYTEIKIKDLPSSEISTIEVIHPKPFSKKILRFGNESRAKLVRHSSNWCELRNVVAVIGSSGFILDAFLHVDEFRSSYPQIASPSDDPLILAINKDVALIRRIEPNIRQEVGFWLGIKYGHEFGHFVSTLLTRVKYFESHPMWGIWPLIISESLTSAQREYIEVLFPKIPLSVHPNSEEIYFGKLIVAPTSVFSPGTIHTYSREPEWVFIDVQEFEWLYNKMRMSSEDKNENLKVAIIRRGYNRRKCLNQIKWENIAIKHGYKLIDPAELSASEQIKLFLHAKSVIGEVGSWIYLAGLNPDSNLILLNNDTDYQVWNEISQLNKFRKTGIKTIKGKRIGSKAALLNYSNVHATWYLTKKNLIEVRLILGQEAMKNSNRGI